MRIHTKYICVVRGNFSKIISVVFIAHNLHWLTLVDNSSHAQMIVVCSK